MAAIQDGPPRIHRRPLVLIASAMPVVLGAALACTAEPLTVTVGAALVWLGLGVAVYAGPRRGEVEVSTRPQVGLDGPVASGRLPVRRARNPGGPVGTTRHYTMARALGEPGAFLRVATISALLFIFGAAVGPSTPAALPVSVVALLVLFAMVAVPTRVTVGGDGVLLEWLGTARFVAWGSVAAIESLDGSVVLALRNPGQRPQRSTHGSPQRGASWLTLRLSYDHECHFSERRWMVDGLQAAWRDYCLRASRQDEGATRLFGTAGGRTVDWVRAVRTIVATDGSYRASAMLPERLWRVVEDPSASRVARTGAALALSPTLDAGGIDRLRAAARCCAEPRLRDALSALATPAVASRRDEDLAATLDDGPVFFARWLRDPGGDRARVL
jgi:hypothetical protein